MQQRILPLEALRGLAALVVVNWHVMLGFRPELSGIFHGLPRSAAISGQIWFVAANGSGAVILFFVLSGFVLTRRAMLENDPRLILRQALRRWPRLMPPVLTSVLLSWTLFRLGAYHFTQAGAQTGSAWLVNFAYAGTVPFDAPLSRALAQGTWGCFLFSDNNFNTSLWTMRVELIGSFLVFALALAMTGIAHRGARALICALAAAALFISTRYYASFMVGLLLATVLPPKLAMPSPLRAVALLASLWCLGYQQPEGVFAMLAPLGKVGAGSLGAGLLILAIADLELTGAWARAARLLGEFSFPLYLVHVPVIASLTSALYLAWPGLGYWPLLAFTHLASLAASLPLVRLNRATIGLLNRLAPAK